MFMIMLKFSDNKSQAPQHMAGHKDWIAQGFKDGVFLIVGSLQPNAGGAILAYNISKPDLEARVNEDPFVLENIVRCEIVEFSLGQTDERLNFLLEG